MTLHEAYCAQILDFSSTIAQALADRMAGDYKKAFLDVSRFMRAGAHAMAHRQKSIDDLCYDLREPRQFLEPDTATDKPSSKKKESQNG